MINLLPAWSGNLGKRLVKAAKLLGSKDFRSLQMLQDTLGKRFRSGIVLYTGTEGISFGKNLFALPIQSLWTKY